MNQILELVLEGELAVASDACEELGWSLPVAKLYPRWCGSRSWSISGWNLTSSACDTPTIAAKSYRMWFQKHIFRPSWSVKHRAWSRFR